MKKILKDIIQKIKSIHTHIWIVNRWRYTHVNAMEPLTLMIEYKCVVCNKIGTICDIPRNTEFENKHMDLYDKSRFE